MGSVAAKTRAVAEAFARALDRDDFDAARAMLADDVEYETGSEILRGPDAVIAPYRTNGEKARRIFDEIAYESRVEEVEDQHATVLYIDHLRTKEYRHRFRCQQRVSVDAAGKVARIVHRELAGERDKLKAFFEMAAIEW